MSLGNVPKFQQKSIFRKRTKTKRRLLESFTKARNASYTKETSKLTTTDVPSQESPRKTLGDTPELPKVVLHNMMWSTACKRIASVSRFHDRAMPFQLGGNGHVHRLVSLSFERSKLS